jgi:2-dehydropantoate 2-reductase
MTRAVPGPVLVMGVGAVGGWVGGRLAAAGVPVTMVGRPRMLDAWRAQGLLLTDLEGGSLQVAAHRLDLRTSLPAGKAPALVLLAVKGGATADAARELQAALPAGTPVLSLQNGIANPDTIRAAAPALTALAGMVACNIAMPAAAHLHRATDGEWAAEDHPALRAWQPVFAAAGVPLALHADLAPLQWGKLLLNLNNAVNALSGLPLRAQLLDRDLRRCMATLIDEALAALAAARIAPARLTPLPPSGLPTVLRLPTPVFRTLAARMLRIDDQARTSMALDLAAGRPTEVDLLNGEVVRLAVRHGTAAPANRRIAELVAAWPAAPRAWRGPDLRAELRAR